MNNATLLLLLLLLALGTETGSTSAQPGKHVQPAGQVEPSERAQRSEGAGRAIAIQPAQELKTSRETISLDGAWDFRYDPQDVGRRQRWFAPDARLPERTTVPGCDQAEHHPSSGMSQRDYTAFHTRPGEHVEYMMMDLKYPCQASAWHRKQLTIPAGWQGREVWLQAGGIMPAAEIWFNQTRLGSTLTSRSPIRSNLTGLARFGRTNNLVIRTYWPEGPRLDGLFNYVSAFSGIYRSVKIEAVPPLSVQEIHVVGRIDPPSATVHFTVAGAWARNGALRARCRINELNGERTWSAELKLPSGPRAAGSYSVTIDMPRARLWSPHSPDLHEVAVTLLDGGQLIDTAKERFGLRQILCRGLRILLNGKPVFLRGGCDDQCYPETICPPASKDFYRKRLRRAKKYGFNYTKSCMEIFVPEFLDAADEVGMMVCQEMPTGLTGKYRSAIRQTMPEEYQQLYRRQLENIIRSDRNHPSVVLYSMISEQGINSAKTFELFCRELPALSKQLNPTALVIDVTHTGGSWTGDTPYGPRRTDLIEQTAGNQARQEPLSHPIEGRYHELDRPFILHEYNWWTSLPELSLKARYDTLPGRLNGVPEMEASAAASGLSDRLPGFVANSRKLKRLLQKSGLELARRNPRISGYHFWLIAGFSWCQEGVFNEFYEEPWDISAEEFRTFNDDTVLLLDDGNRRSFECGRPAPLGIEISHFGPEPLKAPRLTWKLLEGEAVVADGSAKLAALPCGIVTAARKMKLTMPPGPDPARLDLRAALADSGRPVCHNHWTIWAVPAPKGGTWSARIATDLPCLAKAYPQMQALDKSGLPSLPVVATSHVGRALIDYLDQGGRVVLLSDGVLKDYRRGVEYRPGEKVSQRFHVHNNLFRSVPYGQGNHGNMGTVIANHPALGKLPHEGWCDVHFVQLISGVYPIVLGVYRPQRIEPIIRSIGHRRSMVDKAYLFEVGVGRGALLATSLNFAGTYESHPEARYLLECLLRYAAGDSFAPEVSVTKEKFASTLMAPPAR